MERRLTSPGPPPGRGALTRTEITRTGRTGPGPDTATRDPSPDTARARTRVGQKPGIGTGGRTGTDIGTRTEIRTEAEMTEETEMTGAGPNTMTTISMMTGPHPAVIILTGGVTMTGTGGVEMVTSLGTMNTTRDEW